MTCRRFFAGSFRLICLVACMCVATLAARADEVASAEWRVSEMIGAVMQRGPGIRGVVPAKPDRPLPVGGNAVITNAGARLECFDPAEARWRVGSLAMCVPIETGLRLFAGTVLVDIPDGQVRTLDSVSGRVILPAGAWIAQATGNDGLKLICLETEGDLVAGGGLEPVGENPARIRLQPGEVVFLRPGGQAFGAAVTIFLKELLATSRLINGFSHPLPRIRRLGLLAAAQSERLKRVTNAFVAGAKDDDGFQLFVPKPPGAPSDQQRRKR